VGALLDRLRELGLYDSSLIVISSDHGVALPPEGFPGARDVFGSPLSEVAGSALALLVVKPPNSAGPSAPELFGHVGRAGDENRVLRRQCFLLGLIDHG
jgi:arylsulfatase A-like enzyme